MFLRLLQRSSFYLQIVVLFLFYGYLLLKKLLSCFTLETILPHGYSTNRKKVNKFLQCFVHAYLICIALDIMLFSRYSLTSILLLMAGDIEINPGPVSQTFKFCHWNLNSFCAREKVKVSLIEVYNSLHQYDVIALSETMLNNTISNEDIYIEGFSREIYRSDHPSNSKIGEFVSIFEVPLLSSKGQILNRCRKQLYAN